MKISKRIATILLTICLLLTSILPGSVVFAQDEEPEVPAADETKINCALTRYGGVAYLGEGTVNDPASTAASVECLNNDKTDTAWNNWFADGEYGRAAYPAYAILGISLNDVYTIDEVRLYLLDQTSLIPDTYTEVGVYAPEEIIIEYWDNEEETFKVATTVTGDAIQGNTTGDAENIITFAPVRTNKIQAKLKSAQALTYEGRLRAVGMSEFKVFTTDSVGEVEGPVVEAPPVAAKANGVTSSTTVNLDWTYNEEQAAPGQGPWKFLYDKPDQAPAGDAENQDFDFTTLANENWEPVIVPSGLSVQGFDIKNNKEYYYQREITIPADYDTTKNNVIIRFDGVYSNARVWIDEHYVRTHKGGFTTWAADITEYVTAGQTYTLTVGMADIDGSNVSSVWNPTGANLSDPSGASYYANYNIGGITRDVTLEVQPKDYVASVYTNSVFADTAFATQDYSKVDLEIKARANIYTTDASTRMDFKLIDPDGNVAGTASVNFSTAVQGFTNTAVTSIHVENPKLWDAEHPYLYTLESTIVVNGEEVETTTQRIGLREVLFGGKNGSDVNKVYINGKEIKLRGVCRHDQTYTTGRSTSREDDYAEIQAYKDCNVNFIRTSHYQVSKYLLDACDELGIYVEEENASCWGPKWTPNETEGYMEGLKEQVGRDINRPSILIWSLGNESGWASMYRLGYDYVKEVDPNRMVVFSYPSTINDGTQLDVYSVHYDSWNSPNLGSPDMPVLHDEYAPSTVHNYVDLQTELNGRNFWADNIYRFWNNVFEADGALGGSIWAAGDEVTFIPENITKRPGAQGDYEGVAAGDGLWGVVRDPYLRLKPEAYLLKKGYSPIRMDEEIFRFNGERLAVPVKNWYNHTNFSELTLEYTIDGGETKYGSLPSLAPHESGDIVLDIGNENAKQVNLKFYSTFNGTTMLVDEFNVNLVVTSYEFIPASSEAPTLATSDDAFVVRGTSDDDDPFEVTFSKETGLMEEAKLGDQVMITGGPYFTAAYVDYVDWTPAETDGITAEIIDNMAVVTMKGSYKNGQGVEFTVSISKNGIITTDYQLTTDPALGRTVRSYGVCYDIPADMESVSWARDAFHSVYPENHIGRIEGTALKVRPGYETTPDLYGVKPDWSWEMDMKDYSLFYTDDPRDGLVTNDFKCLRENVWYYDVNYPDTANKIRVESEDASISARVEVNPVFELVDDRDTRIQYSGSWTELDNDIIGDSGSSTAITSYNNTEMVATTSDASCELTFTGTGVCVVSSRNGNLGYIKVQVDNRPEEIIRLNANIGCSKRRFVYCINGLEYGTHTVTVSQYSGIITFDGFAVLDREVPEQTSRLLLIQDYYYPDVTWGSYPGEPVYISADTAGSATIRLTSGDVPAKEETSVEYIDTTDIIGFADKMFAGSTLQLSGQVVPSNATNPEVTYTIRDAGTTEATIKGKTLTAPKPGVVVVTASAQNLNGTFEKDFVVVVRNNVALATNGSTMYLGEGTDAEKGSGVEHLNDGKIGGSYWTNFNWDHYVYNDYPETATVGVEFKQAYTVNSLEFNVLHDNGGCFTPTKVIVQYWDEEAQAFVDVPNQSKTTDFVGDINGTAGNTITFDPVTTTKLQAVMTHYRDDLYGRAVALTEFAVFEAQSASEIAAIAITSLPEKRVYGLGEDLDLTGLEVTAYDANGGTTVISDYTVSGFDSTTTGEKEITVSYGDPALTTRFKVTVTEKAPVLTLESITLTGPSQREYSFGESLNLDGLVVTAHYSDGTSCEVTGYQVTGFDSFKAGTQTIIVTYGSETATFTVTVKAAEQPVNPGTPGTPSTPVTPAQPGTGFSDVSSSAWYSDAVQWAVDNGITAGTSATTFSPDASCTRGQVVTFLWRAAGCPAPKGSSNDFTDVVAGSYYETAVQWAVEQGITNGTSATTFSPDAIVTRGQVVTFLWRYAQSVKVSAENPFVDVASSDYYSDAVLWAVAEDITNGTSATTFSPADTCTRAQIVTFLYRYMSNR